MFSTTATIFLRWEDSIQNQLVRTTDSCYGLVRYVRTLLHTPYVWILVYRQYATAPVKKGSPLPGTGTSTPGSSSQPLF
jgi:hypothetical protein